MFIRFHKVHLLSKKSFIFVATTTLFIMSFSVRIMGCGSAIPTLYRNATAQMVEYNGRLFLVDCAEGTQMLMRKYQMRFASLNHIFISHLHGDHFYGLFGLLSSLSMLGKRGKLYIHCPAGLRDMLTGPNSPLCLEDMGGELVFVEHNPDGMALSYEDKRLEVYSFPLRHRVPTWGFIFREKIRQPNIRKDMIERYNLSIAEIVAIKDGGDLRLHDGTIVPNSDLTTPAPAPLSYAYVSDTTMLPDTVPGYVRGATVLYHEATYDNSLEQRARETFHSTAAQAAEIARLAGVQRLYLGHFSARYNSVSLLESQAREIFPNSFVCKDGLVINVKQ